MSAPEAPARAPEPTSAATASGTTSYTSSVCPALSRLRAIGLPMIPRPIKPIRATFEYPPPCAGRSSAERLQLPAGVAELAQRALRRPKADELLRQHGPRLVGAHELGQPAEPFQHVGVYRPGNALFAGKVVATNMRWKAGATDMIRSAPASSVRWYAPRSAATSSMAS